jgi:dipeptidase E
MRLLLSSYYLGADSRPAVLPEAPEAGEVGRAGIVLNALDEYGEGRVRDLGREVSTWESFGYRCEELDLRAYFSAPEELKQRLADLDLVWVLGGNCFVLARAMTRSAFGAALQAQAHRPDFVYAGYSAGACVAGPDLRGIELMDDPEVYPEGYDAAMEPTCLGLVPYRIVPHWQSDHTESASATRADEFLTAARLEHRCLRDGEAIEVEDLGPRAV